MQLITRPQRGHLLALVGNIRFDSSKLLWEAAGKPLPYVISRSCVLLLLIKPGAFRFVGVADVRIPTIGVGVAHIVSVLTLGLFTSCIAIHWLSPYDSGHLVVTESESNLHADRNRRERNVLSPRELRRFLVE